MSDLLETIENGILTLTINRPKAHNTMNEVLSHQIIDALERHSDDPKVRCIVLTGTGHVFCAGGDVGNQTPEGLTGEQTDAKSAHDAMVKIIRDGSSLFGILDRVPKPTLAIMPGAAAGAGLGLALACDFRFCLDTAKLTTAFAKIGLSTDSGLSYFLPKIVGRAKARELCFTADVITGADAYDMGLVTKIAPKETFHEEAQTFAKYLASLPTVAIGYMKESLIASEYSTLDQIFDLEAENVVKSMATEDHKNAAAAFMKKERATFEGR